MSRRAKIRWISYALALCAVMISALLACHVGAGGFVTRIDAQSSRCFGEALSAVERLDGSLRKCEFASGRTMETILCAQIYSDAQSVETSLSMLPVQMDALENISRQIATMGDYAFCLSSAAAEGTVFSEEEMQQLFDFSTVTGDLLEQLEILRQSYEDDTLIHEQRLRLTDSLNNLEEQSSSVTETLDEAFRRIQADIPAFTPIVYDGKFSDSAVAVSADLKNRESVSQSQAMQLAAEFLDVAPDELQSLDAVKGALPCWRFSVQGSGNGVISVSEQGGDIIRYLAAPSGSYEEFDRQACVETCKEFLLSHGYQNMVEDETASAAAQDALCFVSEQDGVICFPDRIIMRVDPKSGELTAFDASGYVLHHHERQLPVVDVEQLRSALPNQLSVQSARAVLLLSPGGSECLCAEYLCQTQSGKTAKIYVNAQTGQQQSILLEGEAESGTR